MADEQLIGYIERITFHNPLTGFSVVQLIPYGQKNADLVCVVGTFPSIQPGETVRCRGTWKQHLVYGKQFTAEACHIEAPSDVIGIEKYLGSGLIKGIGPSYAAKIVAVFGPQTLNIIENTPEKLLEIKGLGPKRFDLIKQCWADQRAVRDVMVFLQAQGVSPAYAQKIFKRYGNGSIQMVKDNPYCLARDIHGIGFKTADAIAEKLGIDRQSEQRLDAGIEYTLDTLASDGHVCYPKEELIKESSAMMAVEASLLEERLKPLEEQRRIALLDIPYNGDIQPFVWSRPLFLSEAGIARELRRLYNSVGTLRPIHAGRALEWVQQELQINLAPNQALAVEMALKEKVMILTGGPGTGKSTITKAFLAILSKMTSKIILAAPTGRAAKRLSEVTNHKASTIHSLLEFDFKAGSFRRNRQSPLDADLLICDEASMVDTLLMYQLLKAIPDTSRLLLVGDTNQLPSVGPGTVLKDLISSKLFPVIALDQIFRQAEGSRIIVNAHRINAGLMPEVCSAPESDFFFIEEEEKEKVVSTIVNLVAYRLPKRYGFHPIDEIQVLAPMRRGILGYDNLNSSLQSALNKNEQVIGRGGYSYAVGDKVMQLRNDYKKEVFNGDIGRITAIDVAAQEVLIQFDEREVCYGVSELDEVRLAYAASIHKYQGSECRCVVIPIHMTHFIMLQRNLVYTGVTRGKQLVVLVGTKQAMSVAVRNDGISLRYTGLAVALANQTAMGARML